MCDMKKFLLLWFLGISVHLNAQNIQGAWSGVLEVSGAKLRLVVNLASDGKCTLDSPDQGAKDIPAVLEYVSADSLSVAVPALGMNYAGRLKAGKIEGVFKQSTFVAPLVLSPGKTTLNRPQTPLPPFAYATEEVYFHNEKDHATLCGTLTYPVGFDKKNSQKVPVVLMVTGSGAQNRDEELFEHKPFAVLADYLAKNGIASLRYDDRGVGKSIGDVRNATTYNLSLDALAGVEYLKALGVFSQVGVLGHSEGGTIALMLAACSEAKVDFIVSLAGTAIRGTEVLAEQNYVALRMSGVSDNVARDYGKALTAVYDAKAKDASLQNADKALHAILSEIQVSLPDALEKNLLTILCASNPWLDYFSQYDPRKELPKVACPVMAINGQMDVQVLPASNLGALREFLPRHDKTLIKEYVGLNHLFQHAILGYVSEYAQIEETISEEVLRDVANWVNGL